MDEDNAPMAFPNGYVYSREVCSPYLSLPTLGCFFPSPLSCFTCDIFLITSKPDQALEEMSAQNDGKVKCPRTHEECDFSKLKKVFIS